MKEAKEERKPQPTKQNQIQTLRERLQSKPCTAEQRYSYHHNFDGPSYALFKYLGNDTCIQRDVSHIFWITNFRVFELSVLYIKLPWFTYSPIRSTTESNSKQHFVSPQNIIYFFQMQNTGTHRYMYPAIIHRLNCWSNWKAKKKKSYFFNHLL